MFIFILFSTYHVMKLIVHQKKMSLKLIKCKKNYIHWIIHINNFLYSCGVVMLILHTMYC